MQKLILSLKKAEMLKAASGASEQNIGALIRDIPSAEILSGDPEVAVKVQVDAKYERLLRDSVGDLCNVGLYREFTLLRG